MTWKISSSVPTPPGKLTGTNYIALEVEFGNRITIAPHEGELTEYNYVVNNIRHFIKERHGEADA